MKYNTIKQLEGKVLEDKIKVLIPKKNRGVNIIARGLRYYPRQEVSIYKFPVSYHN